MYDKGDYILKIEPPQGWSFEPSSVFLHIDGTSDPCSLNQDINFVFKGFSLAGQVIIINLTFYFPFHFSLNGLLYFSLTAKKSSIVFFFLNSFVN